MTGMRPEDISRYFVPGDPRLHPDGATVAFAVVRADLEDDRYESSIWRWDGTNAAPFTHGPGDSRPRWSPDGRTLLFLRRPAEKGGRAQVAVMPAGGGEATVITAFDRGVSEAEWSPDGSRIAVVGTRPPADLTAAYADPAGAILGDGQFETFDHPSLEFLFRAWVWPGGFDMSLLVLLGITSSLGGFTISQAYRRSEAAFVAPFEYAAMPLSSPAPGFA